MRSYVFLLLSWLAAGSASASPWTQESAENLTRAIVSDTRQTVTSVIINHNNEIVYERYFNGATQDTLHDTRSATKTIASMLLGIAIGRGEISSVNDKVLPYFPELQPLKHADPRKSEITLEDFLTMSSRLECNDFNPYSRGNEERMYVMENWVRFTLDLPIKGYAPWETRPADSPFGRSFAYCSAGAYTLGQVVARASGRELSDYAQAYLFDPLDIDRVEWPRTSLGKASTAGGIELSTRSLLNLGLVYVNGGSFGSVRILTKDWVQQSLKSHVKADEEHEYGYLIWNRVTQIGEVVVTSHLMSGNGGNHVVMIPELSLVIVVTKTDYNQRNAHQLSRHLVDELILPVFVDGSRDR